MNILIVEDELLIAEMLKEMLLEMQHNVVGIANNFENAKTYLSINDSIEIIFLDINLGIGKNGLDIASEIRANKLYCNIVFLTSYTDKATIEKALHYNPEAYLVKPFTETDLFTTIEIIKTKNKSNLEPIKHIFIKDGTANIKINLQDILWIESNNIYIDIITIQKKYTIRNSLIKMIGDINSANFVRVHRTFAVNMCNVNAIKGAELWIGNKTIPISRIYKEEIINKFKII